MVSADGLFLFFSPYNRPGGLGLSDLWMSTRATKDDDWGTPVNLGPTVNSVAKDGIDTKDTDIKYDGPIIVGKFVDVEQPYLPYVKGGK